MKVAFAQLVPLLLVPKAATHSARILVASRSVEYAKMSASGDMLAVQNWAVIGDVLRQDRPASAVFARLKAAGRTVHGVNPRDKTDTLFKSIEDAPVPDAINLIINSVVGLEQLQKAAELGVKNVFIQPGAESDEILAFCASKGITVRQGCVLREL